MIPNVPVPRQPRRPYRLRIVLFLAVSVLTLVLLNTVCEGSATIQRLAVIEAERDQWQQAAGIIEGLNLRTGSVVADVGSGVGYFTLKLAPVVGNQGRVLAVDTRRASLLLLGVRASLRGQRNVSTIQGEVHDPHLPAGAVDAVLVANTFHELTDAESILRHLSRALRPGGRLEIVDRGPAGTEGHQHTSSPGVTEVQLRQAGFEILRRQDRFLDGPGNEPWWLIVAAKL